MPGLIPPKAYFNPSTPFYASPGEAVFTGNTIFDTGATTSGVKITTVANDGVALPVSETVIKPYDDTEVLFSQMIPVSQVFTLEGTETLALDQTSCGKITVLVGPNAGQDVVNFNTGSSVYPPGSFMTFIVSGTSVAGSSVSFVYGAGTPVAIFDGVVNAIPGKDQFVHFWTMDGVNWRRIIQSESAA